MNPDDYTDPAAKALAEAAAEARARHDDHLGFAREAVTIREADNEFGRSASWSDAAHYLLNEADRHEREATEDTQ